MWSRLPLKQHERTGTQLWDPEGYTTSQVDYLLLAETQERRSSLLSTAPPRYWRARGQSSRVSIPPQSGAGVGVTLANNEKVVAES